MRLIRLKLTNYRGIDSAEVAFAPKGLTLVIGRNEAGKSSLVEALEILFTYMDSSKNQIVKNIKPVNKDAGPEIELEARSKDYVFVYKKRFLKASRTVLEIKKPFSENLTGREAHERAEAILKETIDVQLWYALLTVRQGEALETTQDQAKLLTNQTALSHALDVAAGGSSVNSHQDDLFKRVQKEYHNYYTERGKERRIITDEQKKETELTRDKDNLEEQIAGFDRDIERSDELDGEISRLKIKADEIKGDVREYAGKLQEIEDLNRIVTNLGFLRSTQEGNLKNAGRDLDERKTLISKCEDLKSKFASLNIPDRSEELLKKADEDLSVKEATFKEADSIHHEAETIARVRSNDWDHLNDKSYWEQMKKQREEIDKSQLKISKAKAKVDSIKVDADTLSRISKAETALTIAKTKSEIAGPNVKLHFFKDVEMITDGELRGFNSGSEQEFSVAERIVLEFPDIARLEVSAGVGAGENTAFVKQAQATLQKLCESAGVKNHGEASRLFTERQEAKKVIENEESLRGQNLRDLTYEDLCRKISETKQRLDSYAQSRASSPALPDNMGKASEEKERAEGSKQAAHEEMNKARESLDNARSHLDSLRGSTDRKIIEVEVVKKELQGTQSMLDAARSAKPDDELERIFSEAKSVLKQTIEKENSAKAELDKTNPEQVKMLSENMTQSLRTAEEELRSKQREKDEVRGRLTVMAEEGLQEKLDSSMSGLAYLQKENSALLQRAHAARLLHSVMNEERQNAQLAYVEPLKEKMEALGHIIFGDSFQVKITEDLSIESRTLKGTTVPFASLSGGTREQLSLILRVACAIIISDSGGPLILDDALGYADPDRLKRMGAVISQAGQMCQIIVLTCVPERYANMGTVHITKTLQ